jgi:hypothetical protein
MRRQGYVNPSFVSNEVFYSPIYDTKPALTPSQSGRPSSHKGSYSKSPYAPDNRRQNAPAFTPHADPMQDRKLKDHSQKSLSHSQTPLTPSHGSRRSHNKPQDNPDLLGQRPITPTNPKPTQNTQKPPKTPSKRSSHKSSVKSSAPTNQNSTHTAESLYCLNCVNHDLAGQKRSDTALRRQSDLQRQAQENLNRETVMRDQE